MKRLHSSDSLGALISICPPTEEECAEECKQKKRKLSVDQVNALERDFEVENKLDPNRKSKLAHELKLKPRQVAVWFQNRRARSKTKQLDRDYRVLKANFDELKCNFEEIQHQNEALVEKIQELKSKLKEENTEITISRKEKLIASYFSDQLIEQASTKQFRISSPSESGLPKPDPDYDRYDNCVSIFKDGGASDSSNSSVVLNNEDNCSPYATNCYSTNISGDVTRSYQMQFFKVEEHNYFSDDEACNFFSDDQAPTLQW